MKRNCLTATAKCVFLNKLMRNFNRFFQSDRIDRAARLAYRIQNEIKALDIDSLPVPWSSFKELESFENKDRICKICQLPNGPFVAHVQTESFYKFGCIKLYDPKTNTLGKQPILPKEYSKQLVSSIHTTQKPSAIYVGYTGGFLTEWEWKDGEEQILQMHKTNDSDSIATILYTSTNQIMAINNHGNATYFNRYERNPVHNNKITVLPNFAGKINSAVMTMKIKLMIVNQNGLNFDTSEMTANEFNYLEKNKERITCVTKAPDGWATLFFGTKDGEILIYDQPMQKITHTIKAHDGQIDSINFDFNKRGKLRFYTIGEDNKIKTWGIE